MYSAIVNTLGIILLGAGCGKGLPQCQVYLNGAQKTGKATEADLKAIAQTGDPKVGIKLAEGIQNRLREYLRTAPDKPVDCEMPTGEASTFEVRSEDMKQAHQVLHWTPEQYYRELKSSKPRGTSYTSSRSHTDRDHSDPL